MARVRRTLTAAGVDASQFIQDRGSHSGSSKWCRGSHHPAAREVEEQLLRAIYPATMAGTGKHLTNTGRMISCVIGSIII